MTEFVGSPDIRPEIVQLLQMADKIIAGGPNADLNTPEGHATLDPEVFVGPLYDLNDPETNAHEEASVMGWIERQLGGKLSEAPIKSTLSSPDGVTVKVFDKPLGEEGDTWFISQWQQPGENQKPYYVFWQDEMYYNLQEFDGYTPIEPSE